MKRKSDDGGGKYSLMIRKIFKYGFQNCLFVLVLPCSFIWCPPLVRVIIIMLYKPPGHKNSTSVELGIPYCEFSVPALFALILKKKSSDLFSASCAGTILTSLNPKMMIVTWKLILLA